MSKPLPFFAAAAALLQELAPVASPLVSVLSETSAAIDRAQSISSGEAPRPRRFADSSATSYLTEGGD
jgi:hypothetical protein